MSTNEVQTTNDEGHGSGFARFVTRVAERELGRMMRDETAARVAAARIALTIRTLTTRSPKLLECTPESMGYCVAMCLLTGLSVSQPYPEVDIIPRARRIRNPDGSFTQVMEANWQIGFRGTIRLTQRAGYRVTPHVLYEGQEVDLDEHGRMRLPKVFVSVDRSWEKMIGVLVTVHEIATGAYVGYEFMDRDQVEKRRDCSEGYRQAMADLADKRAPDWKKDKAADTPWLKWPEEMVKKTAIRYVVARGLVPTSDVLGAALEADAKSDMPEPLDVQYAEQAAPQRPEQRSQRGGMSALRAALPAPTEETPDFAEQIEAESREVVPVDAYDDEPTGEDQQAAQQAEVPFDREAALFDVEQFESEIGKAKALEIRKGLGVAPSVPNRRLSDEQIAAYLDRLVQKVRR